MNNSQRKVFWLLNLQKTYRKFEVILGFFFCICEKFIIHMGVWFLHLYVFMWVCVCMWSSVRERMCIVRDWRWISGLLSWVTLCFRAGPIWTWSPLIQWDYLDTKPQAFSCLCLLRTSITRTHYCTWLFRWVLGIELIRSSGTPRKPLPQYFVLKQLIVFFFDSLIDFREYEANSFPNKSCQILKKTTFYFCK